MEFIIGREASINGNIGRRLCVTSSANKVSFIGNEGYVPSTVSRQHCKLVVETDGSYTLINLKPANITYVNGQDVMRKRVVTDDIIELGSDRFHLDLQLVINKIADQLPMTPVSLSCLEEIWENYQKEKVELQIQRNKSAVIQSVTTILSLLSGACGLILDGPIAKNILITVAVVLAIYFFIIRYRNVRKEAYKLKEFEDQFKQNYVCPCGCGRFLGYIEYKQLVITQKNCHVSKRPYSTE